MKKEYRSPEWELIRMSFESIMEEGINVSENESGGSSHIDDNDDEW